MWFPYESAGPGNERFLSSVGRALLVAQFFEDMLKRTLLWWDVASQAPSLPLEEFKSSVTERIRNPEAYMERVLKRAIEQLVRRHGIGEAKVDLLEKAREARNYIAHDAAVLNLSVPLDGAESPSDLSTYLQHVHVLVRAYNLLSVWAYEFEEREAAPQSMIEMYPHGLEAWILSPLVD